MKKYQKIVGLILIPIILAAIIFLVYMALKLKQEEQQLQAIKIENIDIKSVKSGEYIGTCFLELKKAKVRVVVEDGIITEIEVIEHTHGPGRGVYEIAKEIIRKQNLDVDAVSGATKSSIVMRRAVENALKQGL